MLYELDYKRVELLPSSGSGRGPLGRMIDRILLYL